LSSSKQIWDVAAASYDSARQDDPIYAACMRSVVAALRPYGRVLDAGCGTGLVTRLLTDATDVLAVDYSAESLSILARNPGALRCLQVKEADLRELPFPDGSFDCVLCANTLQHLTESDQRVAAKELLRVLKPGGRYALSVHHYSVEKQRAGWIKEGKPGQAGIDYIFRFTRDELRSLFPNARIRAVGFPGIGPVAFAWELFGALAAKSGRGHMLIAYGEK
jgi:ubiquinone/menaquinone biosynthesis C-methylase UbiE